MERVLIDTFIVPEESKAEFLEGARKSQVSLGPCPVSWKDFFTKKRMERTATTS